MGVNRYGHCLTKSLAGAARRAAIGWIAFVKPGWPLENPPPSRSFYCLRSGYSKAPSQTVCRTLQTLIFDTAHGRARKDERFATEQENSNHYITHRSRLNSSPPGKLCLPGRCRRDRQRDQEQARPEIRPSGDLKIRQSLSGFHAADLTPSSDFRNDQAGTSASAGNSFHWTRALHDLERC
jgi:hypothetical protein